MPRNSWKQLEEHHDCHANSTGKSFMQIKLSLSRTVKVPIITRPKEQSSIFGEHELKPREQECCAACLLWAAIIGIRISSDSKLCYVMLSHIMPPFVIIWSDLRH